MLVALLAAFWLRTLDFHVSQLPHSNPVFTRKEALHVDEPGGDRVWRWLLHIHASSA